MPFRLHYFNQNSLCTNVLCASSMFSEMSASEKMISELLESVGFNTVILAEVETNK